MRRSLLLVLVTLAALPAGASAATDYGKGVFNVLPAGQTSTDQLPLFDGLTPLYDQVSDADVPRFFKSEAFGVTGKAGRTERPRKNVRIVRDSYNVPHIYGKSRGDVEFGAGWVTAEDRALFMEAIRGPARIAAVDVPGVDPFALATSLRQFQPSKATERALEKQSVLLVKQKGGRQILRDLDSWLNGVNAYYLKKKIKAKPWTRNDVAAVASLVGGFFGKGGGNELGSAQLLAKLRASLGPDAGFATWRDLVEHDDSETPVTTTKAYPYDTAPTSINQPGTPLLDPPAAGARVSSAATVAPGPAFGQMSNALLLSASRSATGKPLFVMGPQVGFYYPEFFLEMDLHGGGIDARGVAFPGIGGYVVIGRGKDFAFSATSANTDIADQFLEQLCNADGSAPTAKSVSYMYKGKCRPMGGFDAGLLKGSGSEPDKRLRFATTVHGPVLTTVTIGGKPYAVSNKRSTAGRDLLLARFFEPLNTNKVKSARDFLKLAPLMEGTWNWFYADSKDIGFFSGGRFPKRAPGTYPGLPTLGTGQYDWRGFLSASAHPQAINPSNGEFLNWNSKPAPGFTASDNDFTWGSVQRVQLFSGIPQKATLGQLVSVMNRAGTQDLKAVRVWPAIRDVLATGPAPDAQTQQAADLVSAWSAAGGSRLDRDGDGKVDDPGAAVLDAAWVPLATTVLKPVLGNLTDDLATLNLIDKNAAYINQGTSSFGVGWYGYVDKDLRAIAGKPVASPFSRTYCGNGDLGACRDSLWAVMKQVAKDLSAAQGPDPSQWRADATAERIKFRPGLIPDTARWTNRPTFQQVGQFSGHR